VVTSDIDRGKRAAEKLIAPAGTIHGRAMMAYLPAWTAGSVPLSTRASSTPTLRMDSPRNGESRSSRGPAAKQMAGLVQVGQVGHVGVLQGIFFLRCELWLVIAEHEQRHRKSVEVNTG
jgi:hypothetical protein